MTSRLRVFLRNLRNGQPASIQRQHDYGRGYDQGHFDALMDVRAGRLICPCCDEFHGGDE